MFTSTVHEIEGGRKGRGRGGRGGRGRGQGRGQQGVDVLAAGPLSKPSSKSKKTLCHCLGTRHPFVTNCTFCGYILCDYEVRHNHPEFAKLEGAARAEAFLSCPVCEQVCTPPADADKIEAQGCDESTVKAYRLKDTLLQYDREYAKRTFVHDAQGDYYSNTTWLNEEEKKEMELKERKRLEMKKQQSLRQRKINIRFDIAGRKVFEAESEAVEDNEGPESNVQSCDPRLDAMDSPSFVNADDTAAYQDESLPVLENSELMLSSSKAAELYRNMRKSLDAQGPITTAPQHHYHSRVQYDD